MQIAVGVDGFDFITLTDREADLRLHAGFQSLALIAEFCLDGNPLNIMIIKHRMLDRANRNKHFSVFYFVHGNMLFGSGIRCAGNDFLHRLTAANDGNSGFLDDCNDLTAMSAFVKLHFHIVIPLS